jgi:hypothetical protein
MQFVATGISMKKPLMVLVLIVTAVVAIALLRQGGEHAQSPVVGLPWQIETLPDGGSKVFGLTLGHSSLGEARERFGNDMEVAVIAAPGESGALEAYYVNFTAGVFAGKLILTARVDQATVEQWRQRAVKSEYMNSTTRKFMLQRADLPRAYQAPIASIVFIPSASFDAEIALRRFGPPGVRIRTGEHVEHFLYPEKGLDLLLDARGKEVLQYVAPREFARLRDPLIGRTAPRDGRGP